MPQSTELLNFVPLNKVIFHHCGLKHYLNAISAAPSLTLAIIGNDHAQTLIIIITKKIVHVW